MAKFGLLTCLGSTLTVPLVEAMRASGLEIAGIFIDGQISEKGRKIDLERLLPTFEFLDLPDLHLETPAYFVQDHNSLAAIAMYKRMGIDFLVNAGTPRILKSPVLQSVQGVVNCHPGILPNYRGCMCVEWAIYNGDPVGATVHLMNEGIDEGAIIHAEPMPVEPGASYKEIRTNMLYHQAKTLANGLTWLNENPGKVSQLKPQGEGIYRKPMPADKFQEMLAKLEAGKYRSP